MTITHGGRKGEGRGSAGQRASSLFPLAASSDVRTSPTRRVWSNTTPYRSVSELLAEKRTWVLFSHPVLLSMSYVSLRAGVELSSPLGERTVVNPRRSAKRVKNRCFKRVCDRFGGPETRDE